MILTPNYPKKPLTIYGTNAVTAVIIIQTQITPYCKKNICIYNVTEYDNKY